jgi:glucokinase
MGSQSSEQGLYLGLDIGGTKCTAVVGEVDGQIIDRLDWPSHATRGPTAMIADLCTNGLRLMEKHVGVVSAGAVIGGPLDASLGLIKSPPNLPGWDKVPLKSILIKELGIPANVEHDAAACCLAEARWGAGIGATRLVYLTCGTGLGAGLVFDGKIYRGAHGQNADIGHARFREDGPEAFHKKGSVEAYCAAGALGRLAAWKFPSRWPTAPSSREIADLAHQGDIDAETVLGINARAVGELCAMIGDFLRPEIILLGSLAQYLGTSWIEAVRDEFRDEALVDTVSLCTVQAAGLGDRLQACSSLIIAISAGPVEKMNSLEGRNAG